MAAAVILSAMVLGTTAFAAETQQVTASNTPTSSVTTLTIRNTNNSSESAKAFMDERQRQYKSYIDQQVGDGALTPEEAEEYKGDFDKMSEYCNRVQSRGSGFDCQNRDGVHTARRGPGGMNPIITPIYFPHIH